MSKLARRVTDLARRARRHPRSLLTWFDDAGGVKVDEGYMVVKVDGFSASRARYPWCSYRDFGFKAVTAAVSDVFSKGCRPLVYAVSVGVTPDSVDAVEEIALGLDEAIGFYGGYLENVDTNVGNDVWVDVFVVALCRYLPVPRSVRPGNALFVLKRLGLPFIAYREYAKGGIPADDDVQRFSCRPTADPRIVDLVEDLRICLEGSIDISDTLYETLEQISHANDVGVYLEGNPTDILDEKAVAYAYDEGLSALDVLMGVSEEYTPILVVDRSYAEYVVDRAKGMGFNPALLGLSVSLKEILWRGMSVKRYLWVYEAGRIAEV